MRQGGGHTLFSSKFALVALFAAVFTLAAAPLALGVNAGLAAVGALDNDSDEVEYDHDEEDDEDCDDDCELDSVVGEVTAWICDGEEVVDDDEEKSILRAEYFVIDDDIYVEFGPWWYWSVGTPNVTSIIDVGDEVKVTGIIVDDGDTTIICAWTIENLTTGQKLTIKEEGAPSWAGGPKAFGIDPWPPY